MIRCIHFRPYEKNTLKGFVDLELTRVGLVLHDCTWHRHENGKEWVGFLKMAFAWFMWDRRHTGPTTINRILAGVRVVTKVPIYGRFGERP